MTLKRTLFVLPVVACIAGGCSDRSSASTNPAAFADDGAAITRTLLADDVQRATHRTARIAGLSTAGDTLALLWKRDARGAATALSLFEVDRAAL